MIEDDMILTLWLGCCRLWFIDDRCRWSNWG